MWGSSLKLCDHEKVFKPNQARFMSQRLADLVRRKGDFVVLGRGLLTQLEAEYSLSGTVGLLGGSGSQCPTCGFRSHNTKLSFVEGGGGCIVNNSCHR